MPRPSNRTRSNKRVSRTLPGGRTTTHFVSTASGKKLCHICGKPLQGVSSVPRSQISKSNRTKRVIWRPYGGQVCDSCLKTALKRTARTST